MQVGLGHLGHVAPSFPTLQLRQMNPANSARPVWVALVCARPLRFEADQYVGLLAPEQVGRLIDFNRGRDSVTVRKADVLEGPAAITACPRPLLWPRSQPMPSGRDCMRSRSPVRGA